MYEYETDQYEGMLAETVTMQGAGNEWINAYLARPLGPGPFPAIVLAHHAPGWDEWYKEATRRFAYHGYIALTPNLYFREGHGTPEDVAAKARAAKGVPDDQAVGDLAGAMHVVRNLPVSNGKVGAFGTCSGGRHVYLAACRVQGFDAVADLWGGRVVMAESELNEKQPVAPLAYTADLSCPLLGLFGEEDRSPSPEQVAQQEAELKKYGKNYDFHMYPNAGHGFFYYDRAAYRQEQAVDGWKRVFAFFDKYLSVSAK